MCLVALTLTLPLQLKHYIMHLQKVPDECNCISCQMQVQAYTWQPLINSSERHCHWQPHLVVLFFCLWHRTIDIIRHSLQTISSVGMQAVFKSHCTHLERQACDYWPEGTDEDHAAGTSTPETGLPPLHTIRLH